MNELKVTGNLTRDPESKVLASGSKVVKCGIAVDNRRKNQSTGEWESGDPIFVDIEAWKDAGASLESMGKGKKVEVHGFLKMDQWTNSDGQKRSKLYAVATAVKEVVFEKKGEGDKKPAATQGKKQAPKSQPKQEPIETSDIPF